MTKKDYILIAGAINDAYEAMTEGVSDGEAAICETMTRAIAGSIARALRSDNARFDDIRFMRAAIVDSE